MSDKLSILLVEDDANACEAIIKNVDDTDGFNLIGVTNNSAKALDDIRDNLPDILILDLELHLGVGSGFDVLNGIKSLDLPKTPYILITTNNSSSITYETARQMGADYIMSKHQEGYSEKKVIDFLKIISPVIKTSRNTVPEKEFVEPMAHSEKHLTKRIMAELDLVGISQKAVGHKYLIDAIMITMKEPTQNLCCIIGKKYSKSENSVERAMQNAINRAWLTANIDDLLKYYTAKISSSKGVPTLTEFIFYYANKLNNEY